MGRKKIPEAVKKKQKYENQKVYKAKPSLTVRESQITERMFENSAFYSLVHKKGVKKHRTCLICGIRFLSKHAGHRQCGTCSAVVNRHSRYYIEGY